MEKISRPMSRPGAMAYIFACALLWSTGGVFVKFIDANAFTIAGIRALVAVVPLLFVYRPNTLRFTRRVWIEALSLTATGILFVAATKLTTAANAIVLQYVSPVFIILADRFIYKERVYKADVLVCFGCIGGMTLFFLDELSPGNMLGNFLAILSGLTNAWVYIVMNRSGEDKGTINIATQIETIVLCLPFMFLFPASITMSSALAFIGFGVFQRALPLMLFARAGKYCSSFDAILISMAEPICSPLLVFLLFHESPGKFAFIGGFVVISSVLAWNLSKAKSAKEGAVKTDGQL